MTPNSIQIGIQKGGETVYISNSKIDAQRYTGVSRYKLDDMLDNGNEHGGFTADIYAEDPAMTEKVLQAIQETIKQLQRELKHTQHNYDVALNADRTAHNIFLEASKIRNRKIRELNTYMRKFGSGK